MLLLREIIKNLGKLEEAERLGVSVPNQVRLVQEPSRRNRSRNRNQNGS